MALNISGKQLAVLQALKNFAKDNGYMPSIRELAREMNVSYATIRQYLDALKTRGWLTSDGTAHGLRFKPGKETMVFDPEETAEVQPEVVGVRIPVLGVIAAGRPLEAIELEGSEVTVPSAMAPPGAYALKVRGTSMIEDHIMDGDIIVVIPQSKVENGEVAVALLDDNTATLKRVYKEKDRIRLQPANSTMKPLFVKRVKIRGRVSGLLRMVF
jgi:repressor LexA